MDDLQWADSATLKLIKLLITDHNTKYLLLIGAYRDNEVSITHPLVGIIEEINQNTTVVNNIVLQPLSFEDFNHLISDTLHQNSKFIKSLVDLLYNKTGGNPFFLTQLLLVLYQENLFKFNFKTALWQWDIEKSKRLVLLIRV